MRNFVFWDIRTHFEPHRKHINSPLQIPASYCFVRFVVSTAVTMKDAVFWGVTPCSSCENRRFEGMYHLHHQGEQNQQTSKNISRRYVPPKRKFLQEPHSLIFPEDGII
jgi:hypothetical protein